MDSNQKRILAVLSAGGSRVQSSRWGEWWSQLIESNTSEVEAESLFSSIRRLAETHGEGNVWKVRASEGRRAYLYGLENREHALELLANNSYHVAIRKIPPIHGRHSLSELKSLRAEVDASIERLSAPELQKLLTWLSALKPKPSK